MCWVHSLLNVGQEAEGSVCSVWDVVECTLGERLRSTTLWLGLGAGWQPSSEATTDEH